VARGRLPADYAEASLLRSSYQPVSPRSSRNSRETRTPPPSRYLPLQAESAFSRVGPAGTAEPLITSSQISRAPCLTAAVSPLAALAQPASSFALALAGSELCAAISCLHCTISCCMEAALLPAVEEGPAGAGVVVAVVELLWLVVVELLPHPAMSARHASRPRSHESRLRVICSPWFEDVRRWPVGTGRSVRSAKATVKRGSAPLRAPVRRAAPRGPRRRAWRWRSPEAWCWQARAAPWPGHRRPRATSRCGCPAGSQPRPSRRRPRRAPRRRPHRASGPPAWRSRPRRPRPRPG